MIVPKADCLMEASWEVCNKVGGIYTVVKSKAAIAAKVYQQYILIGPYFEGKTDPDFTEQDPPAEIKNAFSKLEGEGIRCHYGVWEIKGSPNVILVDFSSMMNQADDIKKQLWERFEVDTLFAAGDFTPPMVWSWATARVIEVLDETYSSKLLVAHFHEWLAGAALLRLNIDNSKVKTVFTTHATMLGRAIAGSGEPLYAMIDSINPYEEAKRRGILDKFTTERACAHNCHTFTTVSEITGMEAEKLLGRKPDVLLLNGLDIEKFPTFEETSVKHIVTRSMMREFLAYYFFPHYTFDLEHTLHLFTLGRYEFRNKGIDVFISALAKLNEKLKTECPNRTVAAFIFVPAQNYGIRTELLENKAYYQHIKDFVHMNIHQIEQGIIQQMLAGHNLSEGHVFTKDFMQNNKRQVLHFKRKGMPGLSTHNIDENDQIIRALLQAGLDNREENPVKVIYYPVYLTGTDGLLDLAYYDAIAACHLGVFSSYYEPWGYTPLETAALGVPALTSDMSGYGQFIMKQTDTDDLYSGVKVHKRMNVPENDQIEALAKILLDFAKLDRHERIKNKLDAKRLAKLADWDELFNNYIEAHNIALTR